MIKIDLGIAIVEFPDKYARALLEGKFKEALHAIEDCLRPILFQKLFEEELKKRITVKGIRYL